MHVFLLDKYIHFYFHTGPYQLLRNSKNNAVKWLDTYDYEGPYIAVGTGGVANFHYVSKFNISTDFKILQITNNKLHPEYLYYILNFLKEIINKNAFQGSTLQHLNIKIFENMLIPYPPFEYQCKIVKQLNKNEEIINKLNIQINNTNTKSDDIMNKLFTTL